MGQDCMVTLPPAARVADVATVLGGLAGCPIVSVELDNGSVYAKAKGVYIEPAGPGVLSSCASIIIDVPQGYQSMVEHTRSRRLYQFEWDKKGSRGMILPRTPFWIAAARRLVEFFGGVVDYNDCDSTKRDFVRKPQPDIGADDGAPWRALQQRLLRIAPISPADLEAALRALARSV